MDELHVPGITRFFAAAGFVGAAALGVFAWQSWKVQPILGWSLLSGAVVVLVATLLWLSIFQAIRDHGRYIGERLDLLARQENELISRTEPSPSHD